MITHTASRTPGPSVRRIGVPQLIFGAFLLEVVLAGGNGVSIRFSNRELEPLWGAGLRFGLATVFLGAILLALRIPLPRGRALLGAALYGSCTFGGAFALAYLALTEMHAGFGQILLALVPLATLLLAAALRQEQLRLAGVAGAALALTGIATLAQAPLETHVPLWAVLAALGSVLCFAAGTVLVRRFPPVHPVAMNVVGMGAATVILLTASTLAGEAWALPAAAETWAAVGYLVVVGSGVVFVLYVLVLRHWEASRVAFGFVLIPFVTVTLSAWLDDEPLGPGLLLGGVLVLSGVYLGALRRSTTSPRPARSARRSR